jgi:hypothetical protein
VPEVVPDNGTLIEIWDWTKAIYKVWPQSQCLYFITPWSDLVIWQCEMVRMGRINDMIFLSAVTLLVVSTYNNLMQLYDFDDLAVSLNKPTCRARFGLPMVQPRCYHFYQFESCHPPLSRSYTPIPSLQKSLFRPSHENTICTIFFPVLDIVGAFLTHTLSIHIWVLLGLDSHVLSCYGKESAIPWGVWGLQNMCCDVADNFLPLEFLVQTNTDRSS